MLNYIFFQSLTVLTILENVFIDVNFRGQYIHVGHVHTSEKRSIHYVVQRLL